MGAALEVRGLVRRFGGVTALDGVDLSLAAGATLGLVGPNGSGKTSFFNVLSGHYRPDAGEIRLDGTDIAGRPAPEIAGLGVTRTFQNLRVFRRLSAFENLRAARHARAPLRESLWQSTAAKRRERDEILDLLRLFGLDRKAFETPEAFSLVELRHLEIARALFSAPRLLLLDEPAAGMTPAETELLIGVLTDHVLPGRSAILIEHKLDVVTSLCDRLAVLRAGRKIADGTPDTVLRDPAVRECFLGETEDA